MQFSLRTASYWLLNYLSIYLKGPLKSDDLINILNFPEHNENHVANNFVIQSIRELENGINFFIYLFYYVFFQLCEHIFIQLFMFISQHLNLLLSRTWFYWARKSVTLHDIT